MRKRLIDSEHQYTFQLRVNSELLTMYKLLIVNVFKRIIALNYLRSYLNISVNIFSLGFYSKTARLGISLRFLRHLLMHLMFYAIIMFENLIKNNNLF
jgi:hypothetical protein